MSGTGLMLGSGVVMVALGVLDPDIFVINYRQNEIKINTRGSYVRSINTLKGLL